MQDRRNYDRFAIDIPAVIFDPANGNDIECMIRDISEAGILFIIDKKHPDVMPPPSEPKIRSGLPCL